MIHPAVRCVAIALLFAAITNPAGATTVDLVDGSGSLIWNTAVTVAPPFENTFVDHPNFPGNRHSHEGWYLYIEGLDHLHEFTSFTKTSDGVSQDVLTSTLNILGESFTLDLTYGITAAGPNGLPDLAWSGDLSRGLNPLSPFPVLGVRLFNVFDYDVGADPLLDVATVTTGGATVVEISGDGGVTGQRGAFGVDHFTVDTIANVVAQITGANTLNDIGVASPHDVAGAFEWRTNMCAVPTPPTCPASGSNVVVLGGGFGGFGGFTDPGMDPPDPVAEPSLTVLLLGAAVGLARRRRA